MLVHLKTYKTFNRYVKNFGFSGKTKYHGHVLCIEILIRKTFADRLSFYLI